MLALQKRAPGKGVGLTEVTPPSQLGSGEMLLEVAAAGICGTDLHIDDWADGFHFIKDALPVTLGHEFSGRVVKLGPDVDNFSIGDKVVAQPVIGCGQCDDCRAGNHHDCLYRTSLGCTLPGGFAPFTVVRAKHCFKLPNNVDIKLGALVEPLTTGAHAVALGEVKPGDRVVVLGPGPIGQGAAVLARWVGAREVVIVGHNDPARFETCRRLGFDQLIDLAEEGAMARLKQLAGRGFDVAIEAAGAPSAINTGLSVLKPYGIFVIAGMPDHEAPFDVMLLVRGRHQMRGCSRAPDSAWRMVLDAMAENPDMFAPMITHRLPLSRAMEGFELARSRAGSKILLLPQDLDA